MKIKLISHLKIRLKQRQIPSSYPKQIVSKPDSYYFDNVTKHFIAIKKLEYNGKVRPMVVAHDIIDSTVDIITVYPTTEQESRNRLKSGRWVVYEKR